MDIWAWAVFGAMAILIAVLILKIHLLRKSAGEISRAFEDRLSQNTNTLIDISSRDRCMRSLAADINRQLRLLRQERQPEPALLLVQRLQEQRELQPLASQ